LIARTDLQIAPADPDDAGVAALVAVHMARSQAIYAAEDSHVLDTTALAEPGVTLLAARIAGDVAGIGALRDLGDGTAEIKSMHTAKVWRGRGVASALLTGLIDVARSQGKVALLLEAGADETARPARALYSRFGFTPCACFGHYRPGPSSVFLRLDLS